MVIGNGLIATAFKSYVDNDKVVIFASGVSNSSETNDETFFKESTLLRGTLKKNKDKIIVYFSSVFNCDRNKLVYMNHKRHMEEIISNSPNKFIILRLPQVIGAGGNPNTLVNFMVNKLKNNETIDVYKKAKRNLLDVEDVEKIVSKILSEKIFGIFDLNSIEPIFVEDIVNIIGKHLNITPDINLIAGHQHIIFAKNSIIFESLLKEIGINYNGYTEFLIKKYVK